MTMMTPPPLQLACPDCDEIIVDTNRKSGTVDEVWGRIRSLYQAHQWTMHPTAEEHWCTGEAGCYGHAECKWTPCDTCNHAPCVCDERYNRSVDK